MKHDYKGGFFMESKLVTPKFIISTVVFILVCIFGCFVPVYPKLLDSGYVPDQNFKIKVVAIENETENMQFQVFSGYDGASAFVFPNSTFTYAQDKAVGLSLTDKLVIKCVKGSYLPVFIQDGGPASGPVEDGYQGPYVISMWLGFPSTSLGSKTNICYVLKKDQIGTIGIRIGQKGDYRLVAHENIKFLP